MTDVLTAARILGLQDGRARSSPVGELPSGSHISRRLGLRIATLQH
jgi:hypothetical protein